MSNLLENCNICLSSNSLLIRISSADKNQVKWSTKLNLCVSEVDWGDDCRICPNCIGQLENAYNFYQLCLQSYKVRKQETFCAVKVEPCFESEEMFDVIVKNPIEDEVRSTINIRLPSEVDTAQENESSNAESFKVKIEALSENEEEDECEDACYIPPDPNEATSLAVSDQLPSKSKDRYEKAFANFESWYRLKNIKTITEDLLLTYFAERGECYKPSSLWSTYSMLKSMLLLKKGLDISKYCKLLTYLKRKSVGYQVKKSKVFSWFEIDKFLVEAPDKEYLMMKVVLIIGLGGACRCDELTRMSIDDVQDAGTNLIVTIPNTKTNKSRCFVVIHREDNQHNITYYRKYIALRPPQTPHRRLFVGYRQGKCSTQPVGIHTFGKIPSKIASYLGLSKPTEYTGHCLRRCSGTLLLDACGDRTGAKRHSRWRSSSLANGYVEDSLENELDIANQIQNEGKGSGETSKANILNVEDEDITSMSS